MLVYLIPAHKRGLCDDDDDDDENTLIVMAIICQCTHNNKNLHDKNLL